MKAKYLIVTPGYPSKDNIYNNGFIHSRVKNYIANGMNIDVFYVDKKKDKTAYVYEDVRINTGDYEGSALNPKLAIYKKKYKNGMV